jgi:hypothetical protein
VPLGRVEHGQMPLFSQIVRFAKSPQGRRAIAQASRYARSPEGRARIEQVRRQVAARRKARKPVQ